jgi:hypothetical protein
MTRGLIVIDVILVVVVGVVMYFLIRRQAPREPPHFSK